MGIYAWDKFKWYVWDLNIRDLLVSVRDLFVIDKSLIKFAGYDGQSQTFALPKSTSASNGRSSNSNQYLQHSRVSDDNTSSDRHIAAKDKGNVSRPWNLDTQNSDVYGTGYEKYPSQQAPKRSLPSSLQPSMPTKKSNNFVEDVSSSQIRDAYGRPYYTEGSSLNNGKRYMNDHYGNQNDDEVIMFENGGSRILPPSLTHGKPFSTTQFASSSDHVYRSGVGEERNAENDERLIYQAALQVSFVSLLFSEYHCSGSIKVCLDVYILICFPDMFSFFICLGRLFHTSCVFCVA